MRKNCVFYTIFFIFFDVGNSMKREENMKYLHPPPPQTTPTFQIKNQNKGIEDIMDIDSNCVPLYYLEKPPPI